MKTLKYMSLMMALMCVCSLGLTSCDDSSEVNTPAPVIELDEANIEGDELCVQADIVAQGRTTIITIDICDATGKTVKVSKGVTDSKYIGMLNIDGFHVHVDIAGKGVVAGDMLKLTVVDGNGLSTTAQKSITQEEEDDDDHHHHDHD